MNARIMFLNQNRPTRDATRQMLPSQFSIISFCLSDSSGLASELRTKAGGVSIYIFWLRMDTPCHSSKCIGQQVDSGWPVDRLLHLFFWRYFRLFSSYLGHLLWAKLYFHSKDASPVIESNSLKSLLLLGRQMYVSHLSIWWAVV